MPACNKHLAYAEYFAQALPSAVAVRDGFSECLKWGVPFARRELIG
jgi:hypothetical protein